MEHRKTNKTNRQQPPNGVLTFDIMSSREKRNIPSYIRNLTITINKKYQSILFTPFVVTLGDEFQGVLSDRSQVFQIFLEVQKIIPIYAGVGMGEVESLKETPAPQMTGEAFVRSRKALNQAKEMKRTFMVSTGVDYLDTSVNALAFAAQFIRSKQSKRQMQVSDRFILDPEMPQWQLADELKISRPTVSKILKYGGFDTLDEIRLAIQRILSTSIIDPNGAD
jgi:hypothetical protein